MLHIKLYFGGIAIAVAFCLATLAQAQNEPVLQWNLNLQQIGQSILLYTNENGGVYPSNSGYQVSFKGSNDVTITEPGSTQGLPRLPLFTDSFGAGNSGGAGNNPAYFANFVGCSSNNTGDGIAGDMTLLQVGAQLPSVQFDFADPLTTADHIIIGGADNNEEYQIQAYTLSDGTYTPASLTGWTVEEFSGQTGITPDSTWPTFDASNGDLISNANGANLNEPLTVLTPDQPIDQITFTQIGGTAGSDTGIQFISVPEPASVSLVGLFSVVVLSRRRRRVLADRPPPSRKSHITKLPDPT
jgi:hypothetical protein